MSRKRRESLPPESPLSPDEATLWKVVADRVTPLRAKSRVPEQEPGPGLARPHPRNAATERHRHPAPADAPSPRKGTVPAPPLAEFDRKRARRLARGHTEIEGRIDLHGMRQVEAHRALRAFLLSSHAGGRSTVLVITGKGGPADRHAGADGHERPDRGVLKRNVPRWLTEPELRAIVVSYTAAAPAHGGDGAMYVHLRRRRRPGA